MRKLFSFVLGIVFLLCIVAPQLAIGQDFSNLPNEMKGKITLENSTGKPVRLMNDNSVIYYAEYLTIYYTNEDENRYVYWAIIHKHTDKAISAGYTQVGDYDSCRHWNFDEKWVTTTCSGEVLWSKKNDVARNQN